jgi:hypothetical protein
MPTPSKASATNNQSADGAKTRVRKGFPSFTLAQTIAVAQAIADQNAGKPWSRLSLAEAINRKPDSSAFRELLSASIQYGLTEGSHNVQQIKLTPLGVQATMPKSEGEQRQALLRAAQSISLFKELYEKFDQAKLPVLQNFRNTLIRDHNVDPSVADKCIEQFTADGKFVGLIRVVAGSERVDIPTAMDAAAAGAKNYEDDGQIDERDGSGSEELAPGSVPPPTQYIPPTPPPPSAIFIGHGHDHEALRSLEKILKSIGVKYIIAQDEANVGRPISQKVADEMRKCSSAIFIASADDEYRDSEGKNVKRTRQNVVYELGAASFAYGKRIVIFKEAGVEFATDFSDLGYIEYQHGHLADKFADLLKELVQLEAVKITAGG